MVFGRAPRVFFYCRNEEGNLQDDVIALAEGFREIGIPFSGNCDYWLESEKPGDFLIRHDPEILPGDCDIVIVSYTWPYWIRMKTFDLVRRPLPDGLFKSGRKYRTVYMDNHDGHRTVSWEPEFRQFDLILRSKLNRRAWHPKNMRPWVHGFTRRILRATESAPAFENKTPTLLWNFGASHPYPHGVRTLAERTFLPLVDRLLRVDRTKDDLSVEPADCYESLMWRQTGGRYSAAYYERVRMAQAVACFCGELIPPMPFRDPERYLVGGNRAKVRRAMYDLLGSLDSRPPRLVQWDSFRFWEALCAGAAAFNMDLERYGVAMPEMPQNWKHYVGIDFDRVDEAIDRLESDPELLGNIAREGHAWALSCYSPARMAARLLAMCGADAQPVGAGS